MLSALSLCCSTVSFVLGSCRGCQTLWASGDDVVVPQVRFCLRVCVPDTLRDRAQIRSRAVHRLSDDRCCASGHTPFAGHRRPVDGELSTRDALVRLDCDGRIGRAHIRPWRCTLARALVATVLVGVGVGDCRGRDDWVHLPHAALVSTLAGQVHCLN